MTDLPADWAIEKALRECEDPSVPGQVCTVDQFKNPEWVVLGRKLILAHARLIEQTQPAPVDRKLLVAREAAARYYDGLGGHEIAAGQCREGLNDVNLPVVVEALNLWESGYAAD